jgi:L-alanine-DL-glutamate epimerase-like enolase superfamily enzyme
MNYPRILRGCDECFSNEREAVGADMVLMLDPVFGYDREGALKVAREIEKLDSLYYEDPIPTTHITALVTALDSTRVPLQRIRR